MPCLQTIWALTDFTADNGATNVVPYTHTAWSPASRRWRVPALRPCARDARWLRRTSSTVRSGIVAWRNSTDEDRVGLSIPYAAQWLDPVTTWHNPMPRRVWEQMPEDIRS